MLRLFANPRVAAVVQALGYTLFFCVVVAIALPFTFPTRQLRSFVSRQARAQGYPLEIDELKLHGLGGIELSGIRLLLPGKAGEPGENGQPTPGVPETELKITRLSAKIALWPALFGKSIEVTFDMDAGGGKLENGRFVRRGDNYDVEIGKLSDMALGELGIGNRLIAGNKSLNAGVDGDLNGSAKVHVGNQGEELNGDVDLELADAILKSPELEGGLRMTDLGLGTVTLKVKMGLKSNIAALAAARGSDTATMVHIETMTAEGGDVELITDELAHILIPPGKGGWKQATLQLHFAINLAEKEKKDTGKTAKKDAAKEPAKDEGDEEETAKPEKPADDRVKWSQILTMFGAKLKPFERAGYIGIGCTGPLLRPQCKPELPAVNVGTRGKGGPLGTPEGQPQPGQPQPNAGAQPPPTPPPSTPQPQPTPTPPPPVFQPAVQPQPQPTPPPEPPKPEVKPEEPKPEVKAEKKEPVVEEDEQPKVRGKRGRFVEPVDDEEDQPKARGRTKPADEEDDRPRRRRPDDGDDEEPAPRRGNVDDQEGAQER